MIPRLEICGASPTSILLGSAPLQPMLQTACSAPAGLLVGFGYWPAEFLPSVRAYTIALPSSEKRTSEIGCPSSWRYEVSLRGVKEGPSATQILRLPCWLKVQATRLIFFAAVNSSGN